MSNIDKLLEQFNELEKKEEQRKRDAEEAKKKAEKERKEADEKLKKAKIAVEKLQEAKKYEDEAQAACNEVFKSSVDLDGSKENTNKNKVNNKELIKGLIIGATAFAILAGACKLCKVEKSGTIPFSDDKVTTDTNENQNKGKYLYDKNGNLVIVASVEEEYEELTDEKFYGLVNSKIAQCELLGLSIDAEDIEKLCMMVNVNRLLVDNPDLVFKILGTKDITDDELTNIMLVAERIQDTFNDYNCELFRKTGSTQGFILISNMVFDPVEKEKAQAIEAKVMEIGNCSRTDVDRMNALITPFLTEFYNSSLDVYNLESGTAYGLRYMLRPIRDVFGREACDERNVTLNEVNQHLIKYFVSYVGDENDYYMNGWGTAAYQNTYGILKDGECKTLTK